MRFSIFLLFFSALLLSLHSRLSAQCPTPELYDLDLAVASDNPLWVNCIDNVSGADAFQLDLISPEDIVNYTINWGDGSGNESGALFTAGSVISHTYADLGQYTVTLSETDNGCTVDVVGTLISDRKPGATAIPPTDNTNGCSPHTLTFRNTTTNLSPFTRFIWNWGDGTTVNVNNATDPGAGGEFISHEYQAGTSGCGMEVTLTAMSLCDTTFVTFGPYDMWDYDTANVVASTMQLCEDGFVTFTDQSDYNCVGGARYLQWDLTELPGGSTTGWVPAVGNNRSIEDVYISGPVGTTYTIYMADSNFCGIDYDQVTVEIVPPPTADVSTLKDTVCVDELVTFDNNSSGGNYFYWNYGDDMVWDVVDNTSSQSHSYDAPGDYTAQLVADIVPATSCDDLATVDIHVVESPTTDFSIDVKEGCDSLIATFTDNSLDAINWTWNFGNGETANTPGPHTQVYTEEGHYVVSLVTENSTGCPNVHLDTVYVYPVPELAVLTDSICFGENSVFLNNSTLPASATGWITREKWDGINGSTVTALTSDPDYPNNPNSTLFLSSFEGPTNDGGNYGSRIHGFIYPPETGNYIFWIASDDNSELWLSTDEYSANVTQIASVPGYTNSQQWTKFPQQQSTAIFLEAGKKYYVSALHKEGGGGDNIAVGWQLPSGSLERPIPGSRIAPFLPGQTITSWQWDFNDGVGLSTDKNPNYSYLSEGTFYPILTANTSQCNRTDSFAIFVAPQVIADFSILDTVGCNPLNVEIINASSGVVTNYWNFGDGTAEVYPVGTNDTLNYTFFNSTPNTRVYNMSLVVEGDVGCRDTLIQPITVFSAPSANFTFTAPTPPCAPFDVEFTNVSVSDDTLFTWYFPNVDTFMSAQPMQSMTFLNQTGQIRFDTIRLDVASQNGCVSTISKTVTVFPEPIYSLTVNEDTGCHPFPVQFNIPEQGNSFFWNFGDGTSSNAEDPVHIFNNTTNQDTSYETEVIITSIFSCRDTLYQPIVVKPQIDAVFSASPTTQEFPLSTVNVFNFSSGAIDTYQWSYDDGDTVFVQDPAAHVYDTNGAYTIQLVVSNDFCTDTTEQTIFITPLPPEIEFTGGDSACAPFTTQFFNQSLFVTQYLWDFGDGDTSTLENPTHTYSQPGNYHVTLYGSGNGGSDSLTKNDFVVIVNPPTASYLVFPKEQALPNATFNLVNNSSPDSDRFTWDFGNGDTLSVHSPNNFTYDTIGEYVISLTVESRFTGCKDAIFDTITVLPHLPIPDFTGGDTGCAALPVSFTNESQYADSYIWYFGDGDSSTVENPSHTYATFGSYNVTLVAIGPGGQASTVQTGIVEVIDPPTAGFLVAPDEIALPNKTFTFFNGSSNDATNYFWNFGDGDTTSLEEPNTHTYDTSGTYVVRLQAFNSMLNCRDTIFDTVTILPHVPVADFSGGDTACAPFNVSFVNKSQYSNFHVWSFGDGDSSLSKNPSHIYDVPGEYNVTLIAFGPGGVDSTIMVGVVKVLDYPVANFIATPQFQNLPNKTVSLFNTSSSESTDYFWDFGDGDTSSLESPGGHEYDTSGTYTIQLVAQNDILNCVDTIKDVIIIGPHPPIPDFSGGDTACAPLPVEFSNLTQYGESYVWDFGDGDTSLAENPTHIYTSPGTYNVTLYATGPGGTESITYSDVVTVLNRPNASMIVFPKEQFMPNATVNVMNSSSSEVTSFLWNYGDGDTSNLETPMAHTFDGFGSYPVTLIVSTEFANCIDTTMDTVVIFPQPPTANFDGIDSGCVPLNVSFESTSIDAESWLWNFGDGKTSELENPGHTYTKEGDYTVSLTVTNSSGSDSIVKNNLIHVYPIPVALFNTNPSSNIDLIAPASIFFNNLSQDADFYAWDFGDGQNSTEQNILHTFGNEGVYSATLIASSIHECTDTFELFPPIRIIEGGDIYVPNAFKPTHSIAGNDVFIPVIKGNVKDYQLMIFNRWGELIFESSDPDLGWDGMYRGKLSEQEVYVWRVEVTFFEGNQKTLIGDVTLLR